MQVSSKSMKVLKDPIQLGYVRFVISGRVSRAIRLKGTRSKSSSSQKRYVISDHSRENYTTGRQLGALSPSPRSRLF